MVRVIVSSNTSRKTEIVNESKTIREVLDDAQINYAATTVHLDGSPLRPGDIDKSFDDFGISESCYLTAIVKADNA